MTFDFIHLEIYVSIINSQGVLQKIESNFLSETTFSLSRIWAQAKRLFIQ